MFVHLDTGIGRIQVIDQGRGRPLLTAFPPLPATLSAELARAWLPTGRLVRAFLPQARSGAGQALHRCMATLALEHVVLLVPASASELVRELVALEPRRLTSVGFVDAPPRWYERWLRSGRRSRQVESLHDSKLLPPGITSRRFVLQPDGCLDSSITDWIGPS